MTFVNRNAVLTMMASTLLSCGVLPDDLFSLEDPDAIEPIGEGEEPYPVEDEVEEPWVPPFAPCEDNNFSCGEMTDEVIAASETADQRVALILEAGGTPAEVFETLSSEPDLNVTLSNGDVLMWWVDGGLPRFKALSPDIPDVESLEPTMSDADFAAMVGSDSSSETRRSPLSIHGIRKGFERNTKRALIVSPYYGHGAFWNEETNTVQSILNGHPQYGGGDGVVDVARGLNAGPEKFRNWRSYDLIHVVSHGAHGLETISGTKKISALYTSRNLNVGNVEAGRRYTEEEVKTEILGTCSRLDRLVKSIGDPTLTRGFACGLVGMPYPGLSKKIDTPMLALTSEYMANPRFNSAPLKHTFLNFSACSTIEDQDASGFELFVGEGSNVFAYTGVVSERFATKIAIEFYNDLFSTEVDTLLYFTSKNLSTKFDDKYRSTTPFIWSSDDESLRLNEVILLWSELGALEGGSRPTIRARPYNLDSERSDRLDLDLELRGAHQREDAPGLSSFQIGVFLADTNGKPKGSVLPPGWVSPDALPNVIMIDEDSGAWFVPLRGVKFPMDLADKSEIQIAVQAKLGEGGISQTSYEVFIDDPNCPYGTFNLSAGGGAGVHNVNKVKTLAIPGTGTIIIEFDRATRTSDQLVEESPPRFKIQIAGALPQKGETIEYASEQLQITGKIYEDRPDNSYLAEGIDEPTPLSMTLTHLEDGKLKGRLWGTVAYVLSESEDFEFGFSSIEVDFVSAAANLPGDFGQCY